MNQENHFYRKVSEEEKKWVPSRINGGYEMTRINPDSNMIEVRLLTFWEILMYWKF